MQEREAEETEVLRRHRDPRRDRLRLSWRRREIFEIEVVEVADIVGRTSIGKRHDRHAGERRDSSLELLPELDDALRLSILRRGELDAAADHVVGVETEINASQLVQAGDEQSGDDQERSRDRKLTSDEHSSQATDAGAAG
ncbi:MAG: hypothetical protein AUH43_11285 [Acidobacteria bacterium 13_1_40CM_65_14]|nr:MAG: hypothetical protein AUH43_11285 [Acidobacteria bacterium 13_1_40CM_65_14]